MFCEVEGETLLPLDLWEVTAPLTPSPGSDLHSDLTFVYRMTE